MKRTILIMTLALPGTVLAQGSASKAAPASAPAVVSKLDPGVTLDTVEPEDVKTYLGDYLADLAQDGPFKVYDRVGKEQMSLALKSVHSQSAFNIGDGAYALGADFQDPEGGQATVDFVIVGSQKEFLSVRPSLTAVRTRNGEDRYTWTEDTISGFWKPEYPESPVEVVESSDPETPDGEGLAVDGGEYVPPGQVLATDAAVAPPPPEETLQLDEAIEPDLEPVGSAEEAGVEPADSAPQAAETPDTAD